MRLRLPPDVPLCGCAQVERGVAVELSVQAGHDVPVYITTDPVGGLHDPDAEIFAGGGDAHGVPAEPYKISWTPDSTTPDLVFYQVRLCLAPGQRRPRRACELAPWLCVADKAHEWCSLQWQL